MIRLASLLLLVVALAGCQDVTGTIEVRVVSECPVTRPTTGTVPVGCWYDANGNLVGG